MAEYIEREAAYALSKKICDAIRSREYHPATFGHLILDWIDDLPAADVAPVRRGRWIFGVTIHREWMKCSACNVSQTPNGCFSYCPNCGAKMQGDYNE